MQASFSWQETKHLCHFTKQTINASSLSRGLAWSPSGKYYTLRVISFPKDSKADCGERLQRSGCCFAFILDSSGAEMARGSLLSSGT